ncbi:DNA internalization-related competence protein ComEC/Rec2 [Eubacteriaceae bacterium ES3]|nr:DNA internalization-related competence protein ComEC/Rec2 [Eubacteriaceae bacterium ES3]
MKRPLFWGFLFLSLSIILTYQQFSILIIVLLLLPLIIAPFFIPSVTPKQVVFVLIIYLTGIMISTSAFTSNNKLDHIFDQKSSFSGKIITVPEIEENQVSFVFKVNSINSNSSDMIFLVNSYDNNLAALKDLLPGDLISFDGELQKIDAVRNPGGFDYSLYLKSKRIDGLVYYQDNLTIFGSEITFQEKIAIFRKALETRINAYFNPSVAELLKGILLGDKSIDETIKTSFQNIGISHILAVSGLHIGFLALLVTGVLKILKIRENLWFVILSPFLLVYCILTGFSASVIRASLMLMILLIGKGLFIEKDLLNNLYLSGIIILLIWPAQLFQAGFQLSMSAVLGIILFNEPLNYQAKRFSNKIRLREKPINSPILESFILSISVFIITVPIIIAHFGTFNGISFLANLIIIPLVGLFVICGFIFLFTSFICPPLIPFIVIPTSFLGDSLIISTEAINAMSDKLSFLAVKNASFDLILVLLLIITGFLAAGYFNGYFFRKFMPLCYCLFLTIYAVKFFIPGNLEVIVLDVGQGDSILITTPHHYHYLIDGGGYLFERENRISDRVLYPAFRTLGISSLNFALISHNHADHQQGIEELITDDFSIEQLMLSINANNQELFNQKTVSVSQLKKGSIIESDDGVRIEVLWPEGKTQPLDDAEQNNASLVFMLSYKNVNYLFCGDIEKESEVAIMKDLKERFNDLDIQVLKVPHHGSETSSSREFIETIAPELAVISVGENNMYGHPDQSVLSLYLQEEITILRTDLNGAIIINSNGKWIRTKTFLN